MSEKITFYYNPMSRGRIVHWMLEEVEVDYETKILTWEKGDHKQPEYLRLNPMGKIPTIVHRDVVVTECAAICAYLADAFPEKELAPATGDPARGTYYRWLFFAAGCVEPALLERSHPRNDPVDPAQLGWGSYEDTVKTLEKAVSNGFVLGDRFSAADVYIGSQIGWGLFTRDLEPRAAFQNYVALCAERPAYKRYMEKAGPIE